MEYCHEYVKDRVEQQLKEAGISNVQSLDAFGTDSLNPFCGLETEYLQRKYYKGTLVF